MKTLATIMLDQLGKKFCQQGTRLRHVEWRSSLLPAADLLIRQARAADLILVGSRHRTANASGLVDPGVVLLRTGRPVLVVPDTVAPLELHRSLVAWKDTRECRRAVRDAIPLLQKSREVLLLGLGEDATDLEPKQALADVGNYLLRHEVVIAGQIWRPARGPVAGELLQIARDEDRSRLSPRTTARPKGTIRSPCGRLIAGTAADRDQARRCRP
jgi:hypothetical protein